MSFESFVSEEHYYFFSDFFKKLNEHAEFQNYAVVLRRIKIIFEKISRKA